MDLSSVRTRRKRSLFRPWNSYLAKKAVADAAPRARYLDLARDRASEGLAPHFAPVARLTTGLLDTYEGINTAYYQQKKVDGGHHQIVADEWHDIQGYAQSDSQQVQYQQNLANRVAPSSSAGSSSSGNVAAVISGGGGGVDGPGSTGSKKKKKSEQRSVSPLAIQYCDENFDYIVRTGEMFNNRYMLEKVIGRGSFGQVVRALDTRDNTHVAIKIIKNNSLYVEQALSEVRMTSYLNRIDPEDQHSIMRLRDKFIFRGHQCLVLELLSFSLYDLLRSTEFYGVSLNLVRKFCKQILKCLAFLARPDVNIAHCDLKPENVLLRHPQRSAIKVVDFGASCRITESMFTYVQSRFYRAPEVILGLPYATQVDVWSLGCMLIELHTGYPVFAGKDESHQMGIIVERLGLPPAHMLEAGKKTELFFEQDAFTGEWQMRSDVMPNRQRVVPGSKPITEFVDHYTGATNGRRKRISGGHSEADYRIFLALADKMLQYDPAKRISADEALRDAFVRGACSRTGRESPPPIPTMSSMGHSITNDLDSGRKPPVQRTRKGVDFADSVKVHTDDSLGNLSDVAEIQRDVGGKLRLSKSEPAFEPIPKKTFVFKTSDWAEEVGIEPPPWRAGGAGGLGEGRREEDLRRNLPGAGGGKQLSKGRREGGGRLDCCVMRGIVEEGVTNLGRGKEVGMKRGVKVVVPGGHGNVTLLFMK